MTHDSPPDGYVVRAYDEHHVVKAEAEFRVCDHTNAQAVAQRHRVKLQGLYPMCQVRILEFFDRSEEAKVNRRRL